MKTLTKKLYLTILAFALVLCTAFGVILTTPLTAKADETTEPPDFSSMQSKVLEVGDDLAGKWLFVPHGWIQIDLAKMITEPIENQYSLLFNEGEIMPGQITDTAGATLTSLCEVWNVEKVEASNGTYYKIPDGDLTIELNYKLETDTDEWTGLCDVTFTAGDFVVTDITDGEADGLLTLYYEMVEDEPPVDENPNEDDTTITLETFPDTTEYTETVVTSHSEIVSGKLYRIYKVKDGVDYTEQNVLPVDSGTGCGFLYIEDKTTEYSSGNEGCNCYVISKTYDEYLDFVIYLDDGASVKHFNSTACKVEIFENKLLVALEAPVEDETPDNPTEEQPGESENNDVKTFFEEHGTLVICASVVVLVLIGGLIIIANTKKR